MAEPIIQVRNLTAAFGDHLIFDDISFDVNRGEVKLTDLLSSDISDVIQEIVATPFAQ